MDGGLLPGRSYPVSSRKYIIGQESCPNLKRHSSLYSKAQIKYVHGLDDFFC